MTTLPHAETTGTPMTRPTGRHQLAKPAISADAEFQSRYEMVLRHTNLVRALALSTYGKLVGSASLEDLIHAGIFGLYQAVEEWNAATDVAFVGLAKTRIRGAMLTCTLSRLAGPAQPVRSLRKGVSHA